MRLPFSLLPMKILRRLTLFHPIAERIARSFPHLDLLLKQAESDMKKGEYITSALNNAILFFIFSLIVLNALQIYFKIQVIVFALLASLLLSLFVFVNALIYPGIIVNRKVRNIEKNLMPAMQDMLAQLNSGVPIFNVLVNVSNADYGEVSKEFGKAVRRINAGVPQTEVLAEMGAKNPSIFFRRTVWQISNGLTSGANMVAVVRESIKTLADEQIVQIQEYGSRLSPLSMFYMIIAVILPILAITFMIILASLISLSQTVMQLILWGFYTFMIFVQIMFLGMIKSRRPNLL